MSTQEPYLSRISYKPQKQTNDLEKLAELSTLSREISTRNEEEETHKKCQESSPNAILASKKNNKKLIDVEYNFQVAISHNIEPRLR